MIMSFLEFFKIYWKITNRDYCDEAVQWIGRHINWDSPKAIKARNKGQKYTSKLQRKILICLQYLFLAFGIVLCVFNNSALFFVMGSVLFILISGYEGSDFSIVKVALLYLVLTRKSVYSCVLYRCFMGDFDVSAIKCAFNKKDNVWIIPCGLFEFRSRIKFDVFAKRDAVAKIVLLPNCVVLKAKNERIKIKKEYESYEELLSVIGKNLKETMTNNSDCAR